MRKEYKRILNLIYFFRLIKFSLLSGNQAEEARLSEKLNIYIN
jgi:hypothetical protein